VYGLRATALRLTNTYGPRMRIKDARQTFLGVWMRALVEGRPFEVWGGEQLRDFTYVDDAVEALILAAAMPETDGQVYNIGGDPPVSLADLGRLLVRVGGGSFEIKAFPPERKQIDIGNYYADDRKFRQATGWRPTIALEEGLRRTLAFYRQSFRHYL
jgi:UDP-glucose 4-epimerase